MRKVNLNCLVFQAQWSRRRNYPVEASWSDVKTWTGSMSAGWFPWLTFTRMFSENWSCSTKRNCIDDLIGLNSFHMKHLPVGKTKSWRKNRKLGVQIEWKRSRHWRAWWKASLWKNEIWGRKTRPHSGILELLEKIPSLFIRSVRLFANSKLFS